MRKSTVKNDTATGVITIEMAKKETTVAPHIREYMELTRKIMESSHPALCDCLTKTLQAINYCLELRSAVHDFIDTSEKKTAKKEPGTYMPKTAQIVQLRCCARPASPVNR